MSSSCDVPRHKRKSSVSPPPLKRSKLSTSDRLARDTPIAASPPRIIPSQIELTRIRDLADSENIDTLSLSDLVGDPLITECWQFNYLLDVDFILDHFDHDTRYSVKLKVVHGSWRREDSNGQAIAQALKRWPNVEEIKAWLDDPFGTHHSKMMIIFRNDDTAQVVVHTANMIRHDWTNFTQAVWRSPLLPMATDQSNARSPGPPTAYAVGSGERFKADLFRYLESYGQQRTGKLVDRLERYQFSSIRAALVASCPSKAPEDPSQSASRTAWGWPGLKQVLSSIPIAPWRSLDTSPSIHVQVSSIASFGRGDAWSRNFWNILKTQKESELIQFNQRLIFPTVQEIQGSLDGYGAGGSIHLKIQSEEQKRQLESMRPMLCHWSGASESDALGDEATRASGRRRAAPHIKTYIRFKDQTLKCIDWALVTSANLSRQAWGVKLNNGDVKISSYEIGVMVWPALFKDPNGGLDSECTMVPCFKKSTPGLGTVSEFPDSRAIVGFRMPYDLPLVPYGPNEMPWSPSGSYADPDWLGRYWQ